MAATLSELSHEAQRQPWQTTNIPSFTPGTQHSNNVSVSNPPDSFNSYYMPPPVQDTQLSYQLGSYPQFCPPPHPSQPQYDASLPPKGPSEPYTESYYPSSPHSSHSSYSPQSLRSHDLPPALPPRPLKERPIVPDPLPPHSNPQALTQTQTQSQAFSDSKPVPPLRIEKDDAYCTATGLARYTIRREAAHVPSFLSTKPLLTVVRASNGIPAGNIKFHTLTISSIEMTVDGRKTTLSYKHGVLHSRRWSFQPTSTPNKAETWHWKKDKSTGGAMLEEGKHKHSKVMARMKGDLLTLEKAHMTDANYDEIVVSALAMAEAARRARKGKDIVDLASAIGDLATTGGGGGHGSVTS